MNTCATCRFMAEPHPVLTGRNLEIESGHHRCARIERTCDTRDPHRAPALIDAELGHGLLVLPTFGCVLHEAKV